MVREQTVREQTERPTEATVPLSPHIAFGLGSNMGDREAHLRWALQRISQRFGDLESASLYRTEAISDVPQDDYLNTVVIAQYPMPVDACDPNRELRRLLATLKAWEREAGRRPGPRFGPRPLDLDILLWGNLQCRIEGAEDAPAESHGVILPHPRLALRRFVLAPLAELRPRWKLPGQKHTVRQLLDALGTSQPVERLPDSPTWPRNLPIDSASAACPPQERPAIPRRLEIR